MCVNYPKYNEAIGISKKIKKQIQTFGEMGFEVSYSAYSNDSIQIFRNDNLVIEKKYPRFLPSKINRIFRKFYLMRICCMYLKDSDIDVGFIRWSAIDKNFLNVINCMKKNTDNIIMDCHGYFPEYNPSNLFGKYIKYTTNKNYKKLQGKVSVILTETYCREVFGIQAIPMDTCIDVNDYSIHKYDGDKNIISMISVSSEKPYHGYDRLIQGLRDYYKLPNRDITIYLNLVGEMSQKLKKMVKSYELDEYVKFWGYQTGRDLDNIYNMCNIAVGPLAPHRTGGKMGTGMKTKEYFAKGIPYFYAGSELLVPSNYPYAFPISSDDTPVCMENVLKFYDSIRRDEQIAICMREFAKEKYSWKDVFSRAFDLMKKNDNK